MHKAEAGNQLKVSAKALFSLAEEMFDLGKTFVFTVTGNSMYPLLRHEIDAVELKRASRGDIAVGDIVLAVNEQGAYILHRVVRLGETGFTTLGDGLTAEDEPFANEKIVGKVVAIFRREKRIACDDKKLCAWVRVWSAMRPVRGGVLSVLHALQAAYHGVRRGKSG